MTRREEVEILYRYIVEGKSMERVGNETGWTTGEVSDTVRGYGFNQEKRGGWQRGADCGNYAPGKRATHGVKVTRQIIDSYIRQASEWDGDFESFCAAIADEQAAERRRAQEEADRQNRWRAEQQRAEEQRRQEQARRAEAERKAQEQREREEKKAQEQRERDYGKYIEAGKRALRENRLQDALNAFLNARSCKDTWETNCLLAETYAKASNANEHADEIIKELTEYADELAKNNRQLSADQHLWLARAYLARGDKNRACDEYYRAGDVYYEKGDLRKADEIYTEGNRESGYYSGNTPHAPLRMAQARAKKPDMTMKDHEWCAEWYEIAIDKGDDDGSIYAARALHLLKSEDKFEAADCAREAIDLGFDEPWVYQVLLEAQVESGYSMDDANETLEEMERRGIPYEPWIKGKILQESYDHEDEEAAPWYKKQLEKDPNHQKALEGLLYTEPEVAKGAEYGLRLLRVTAPRKTSDRRIELSYPRWARTTFVYARSAKRVDLQRQALEYWPEKKAALEEMERKLRDASNAVAQGDFSRARSLLASVSTKASDDNNIYDLSDDKETAYYITLGEAYARASDAQAHAKEITENLGYGLYKLREKGQPGTVEQNLWVARAYLALDETDKAGHACAYYFRAGDLYYEKNDFVSADEIYTEGRNKTGYYSGSTPNAAYRVAYSREQARGAELTAQDHAFCQLWYEKSISDGKMVERAYRRRLTHLLALGAGYAQEAADCAQAALDADVSMDGKDAFTAFYNAKRYEAALEVAEKQFADTRTFGYERGACLLQTGRTEDAMQQMYVTLLLQNDHTPALDAMLEHCAVDDRRVVLCGNMWLKKTGGDEVRAAELLERARATGFNVREILEYNPEEKRRVEEEAARAAAEEKRRLEEEAAAAAAAEKHRREDEMMLMLF